MSSQWKISAVNSVNNSKIETQVEADSADAAKEVFWASRKGMSLEITNVEAVAGMQQADQSSAEKQCPKCAETVKAKAEVCRFCGHEFVAQKRMIQESARDTTRDMLMIESQKKSAGVAALLNLLIAGAGYIYCGRPILGILAFLVTVTVTVFTAGFGWFAMALILVIDGILSANRYNKKLIEDALLE